MHKIAEKEFTLEDFSTEHLNKNSLRTLEYVLEDLNHWRNIYINGGMDDNYDGTSTVYEPKNKDAWWQMIQLLPSSYNQKRTVMMNYEVLANIYKSRKNHKLDEWSLTSFDESNKLPNDEFVYGFCDWIKTLPYSELITGYTDEIDLSVPKEVIDNLERNDLQAEAYRILKEEINNRFGCKEDEK